MKGLFKKIVCAATAAVTALGVSTVCASAVLGDINDSGKANAADARLLLRYSAKLETLDEAHLALADYNCDGKVNSADARILLRAAAKLDDLEYYKDYYFEMTDLSGFGGSFGRLGETVFAEASMTGLNMAILYLPNGDFIFIDHEGKQYAVLTVSDQKDLERMIEMQGGGEKIDFKEMLGEAFSFLPEMPTPAKLLEDGYVKSAGEWDGQAADVYTKGTSVYYFNGRTLLAIVNGSETATYKNFTESPEPYIFAFRNGGYKEEDFVVMMMTMAGVDLF
ncbi:MAG: dockerin type I repeat-containing protein [Clostridia bacterium]|nr:dockerin type I repeat-containing protein [Clostridia bacterium]